jgi:hypothetical protein
MNDSLRSRPGTLAGAVVLLTALTLGACNRAHLTASHGRAYHAAFVAQDANPDRKGAQSVHGLDAQEAAIVAGSYRKALGPRSETPGAGNGQMLMINPQRGDNNVMMQPSVPAGQ